MKESFGRAARAISRSSAGWGVLLVFAAALSAASSTPVTVSPSGRTGHNCPSFSWSAAPAPLGYELIVYQVSAEGELAPEPALVESLPAGALSWTPPLDRCLVAGTLYAWWIGARESGSDLSWSAPAVIEIDSAPSLVEVKAALATLERYRSEQEESGTADDSALTRLLERGSLALPPPAPSFFDSREAADRGDSFSGNQVVATQAPSVTVPFAALKVEGEVRTLDPTGEPRLWGRGRQGLGIWGLVGGPCTHGTLSFGLSTVDVDWGSAADACPAGTWVCGLDEIAGTCNTGRPDSSVADGRGCDNSSINHPPEAHEGWVQDSQPSTGLGRTRYENTAVDTSPTCATLPVWCCWE